MVKLTEKERHPLLGINQWSPQGLCIKTSMVVKQDLCRNRTLILTIWTGQIWSTTCSKICWHQKKIKGKILLFTKVSIIIKSYLLSSRGKLSTRITDLSTLLCWLLLSSLLIPKSLITKDCLLSYITDFIFLKTYRLEISLRASNSN